MRIQLKSVLVAAFLLTLPTMLSAQASVGFRGGLSMASVSGDDVEDLTSTTGVNIGAFVNFPVSDIVSIQVGAGFAQKGAEEDDEAVSIDAFPTKIRVNYVEVPLLLKIAPPTSGSVAFNLFVGPAIGFKAGCSVSVIGGPEVNPLGEDSLDCDDPELDIQLTSTDFGAMGGVGVDIAVGDRTSLVIQGFYNLGLTNINDTDAEDESAKNGAFSLLAGLSFTVGG